MLSIGAAADGRAGPYSVDAGPDRNLRGRRLSGLVGAGVEILSQESRSARADAFMWAIASIVTMGLTPEAVGNVEASQMTAPGTSQT
jgi:hypothetical protein